MPPFIEFERRRARVLLYDLRKTWRVCCSVFLDARPGARQERSSSTIDQDGLLTIGNCILRVLC